jgi:release factor glutamine methyltransferase
MITVQAALQRGQSTLFYAEVETPLLDATVLLGEALGLSKEQLLACPEAPVQEEGWRRFQEFLDRRCRGIPVSYIRRKKEFFSLEFYVDERVLVPRPDTEALVEEALRLLDRRLGDSRREAPLVHDACTGSGCVAIALQHSRPGLLVSASDISPGAEEVFRLNCRRLLGRELPFHRSDLLEQVAGPYDLITANPPYLRDGEVEGMRKVGWPEPREALAGGRDGTSLLAALVRQAPARLAPRGFLLLEADPAQAPFVRQRLLTAGFQEVEVVPDLGGRPQVIRGRRP